MIKTLALVQRALRVDSRDIRPHIFRCALAGVVLMTLLSLQTSSMYISAPGLNLFQWVMQYNYWFITAAGVSFFATAITEEKEERTLSLMKMAGIGSATILMGKWIPRLIGALILVLIQIPFTVLAITLGGVLWGQIGAAYLALLAHLFLVGNVGLLASVVCAQTSSAAGLAILLMVVYHLGPLVVSSLIRSIGAAPTGMLAMIDLASDAMGEMLAYRRLNEIMSTGFDEQWISFQVIANLAVGGLLLLLAWLLFEPFTRNEVEPGEPGWLTQTRHLTFGLRSGRCWEHALIWKEFHYLGGGMIVYATKLVAYFSLVFFMTLWAEDWRFSALDYDEIAAFALGIGCFMLVVEGAIIATRIYRDEMTKQTWSVLTMMPYSMPQLAYTKLLGGALGLIPVSILILFGCLLNLESVLEFLKDVLADEEGVIFAYFCLQILMGVHLACYISVAAKWAIWPLAIFCAGFIIFMLNFVFISCMVAGMSQNDSIGIFFLLDCFCVVALITMHFLIGKRLHEIAAE